MKKGTIKRSYQYDKFKDKTDKRIFHEREDLI